MATQFQAAGRNGNDWSSLFTHLCCTYHEQTKVAKTISTVTMKMGDCPHQPMRKYPHEAEAWLYRQLTCCGQVSVPQKTATQQSSNPCQLCEPCHLSSEGTSGTGLPPTKTSVSAAKAKRALRSPGPNRILAFHAAPFLW